jgi:gliding motility-associated-like protein
VHLTNSAGCDSAATLNLTLKTNTVSSTNHSTCSSYLWNGTTYTTSGTYTYLTTNAQGCDSTATLVLVITQPTSSTTNISVCPGALPYTWNTQSFASAGSYVVHLTNSAGCDSAATLNLTLKTNTVSSTNHTACSSYLWNGTNYTTSGTYTYLTTNAQGCDSTATLVLVITQPTTSTTNISVCPSALPYIWNTQSFASAGSYVVHLTNSAGCDSTATLNLFVKTNTVSSTNHTACSSYLWNGTTYTTSGTYTYLTTNAQGCDSTATLVLVITQPTVSSTNISVCPSALPYTWNAQSFASAGSYVVHLTNGAGCDSAATLVLNLLSQPSISLQDTFRVWAGTQITLDAFTTNSIAFKWSTHIFLDYDTIENPTCTPMSNIKYTLKATSVDGCEASKNTYVKLYKDLIIVNVFSPNGDGINDTWDLSVLSEFSNITVQVFDRSGNIVFQSRGYSKPWNGTRNGQALPVGAYYYVIDVPNYKKLGGSITILK